MASDLVIAYEDDDLLIVDKPSGLLMHPSWLDRRETDTLAGRVKSYAVLSGQAFKVHTVHRLDRPTSGLVIIAKTEHCARHLGEQFLNDSVSKRYWVITRGFAPVRVVVDYPLVEEHDKIADKFAQQKPAQSAITVFKRLGTAELALPVSRYSKSRYSFLECQPQTGRKHQIRRHLKHLRYPVIGDTRYGCRHHTKVAAQNLSVDSLALRAVELCFVHPVTKQAMKINAEVSPQWQQWLAVFGWS